MTYDPDDLERGLVRTVGEADQHSQIARLTRLLDGVTDELMEGGLPAEAAAYLRGQGNGLAMALAMCTCYSLEEVKAQVMLRWEDRQEEEPPAPVCPQAAPAGKARGRRKRSS